MSERLYGSTRRGVDGAGSNKSEDQLQEIVGGFNIFVVDDVRDEVLHI